MRLRALLPLILGLVCALRAAEPPAATKPAPPPTPLGNAVLAPALIAAAARDGILLGGTPRAAQTEPRPGDAVVAWIGASDASSTRQWLLQIRRAVPTAREARAGRGRDVTRYLSWGPAVTFKSEVEALDLWLAGPVVMTGPAAASTEPAPVKRLRVSVAGDYLRLGLDDHARVNLHMLRVAHELIRDGIQPAMGNIYSLSRPVSPEKQKWAKPVAEQLGFTPEMERAWAGGQVAVRAFFELVNDVPELRAIAAVALDRPSPLQLVRMAFGTMFKTSLGGSGIAAVDPARMGLMPVGLESFALPYTFLFGDTPLVSGEMVVTKPIPPLDVSAGILGVIAVHPRDNRRMVHIVLQGTSRSDSR